MAVKITYFVHGTSADNESGISSGWSDADLSELGIQQSIQLKSRIKGRHFDAVFCSDLKRAAHSAKLTFGAKKIISDKRLRECNYGDFTGKPSSQFEHKMADYVDKPFPNGESYNDVEKRIVGFLKFLKKNYDGKYVAIVSHQGPQLALNVLIKKKTWKQAISEDWRKRGAWQPGWEYVLE